MTDPKDTDVDTTARESANGASDEAAEKATSSAEASASDKPKSGNKKKGKGAKAKADEPEAKAAASEPEKPADEPAHDDGAAHAHDAHTPTLAEPDGTRAGVIGGILLCAIVLIIGVVVGIDQLFTYVMDNEVTTKVLAHQNTQLRELRAQEEAKLTQYQWVDGKHEQLRIPLDRAMELTLADYRAAASAPKPEPTAAPSAEPAASAAPDASAAPSAAPAAGDTVPAKDGDKADKGEKKTEKKTGEKKDEPAK